MGDGSYVLVGVQVLPEDYWDRRALAYAAHIYGHQLKKGGDDWRDIKKVICINILGGGVSKVQWDEPKQFRYYQFKDQNNNPFEDGIEILQYPLFYDATLQEALKIQKESRHIELQEWLDLLQHTADKIESDVEQVETPDIRNAYEKIKTTALPKAVVEANDKQDEEFFKRSTQYINAEKIK